MTTFASRPLTCWSLLTSFSCGIVRNLLQQLGRPLVELVQILARQGVLILRVRQAAADLQILHCLEVQGRSGDVRELGTQPCDHLVGAESCAPIQRLQDDIHAALVLGRVAADESQHVLAPPDPSSQCG